jgi:hypothetical protein
MPRCQRTFRGLPEAATTPGNGGGRWVCPYCPDAELYETVRAPDLLEYARQAEEACIRDFGRPDDADRCPTLLLRGLRPECVRDPRERRYVIYLQRDSDAYQTRLQIGHEVFHRVCSQGRIFHWTHEMLACLVSVRLLRRNGFDEYAEQTAREYRQQAEALPLSGLLRADLWAGEATYPPGFYGRAYVTGHTLLEAVGWGALTRLARRLGRDGAPDVDAWLSSLPAGQVRAAAEEIVGITAGKR